MSAGLATPGVWLEPVRSSPTLDGRVSHWVFDACPGQISARNGEGRLLMAITANPLFGPRLAAAFSSPAAGRATATEGWRGFSERSERSGRLALSPWVATGHHPLAVPGRP